MSPSIDAAGHTPRTAAAVIGHEGESHDPEGLDSNRYRVIGNGVAAPFAEWIGRRIAEAMT